MHTGPRMHAACWRTPLSLHPWRLAPLTAAQADACTRVHLYKLPAGAPVIITPLMSGARQRPWASSMAIHVVLRLCNYYYYYYYYYYQQNYRQH